MEKPEGNDFSSRLAVLFTLDLYTNCMKNEALFWNIYKKLNKIKKELSR